MKILITGDGQLVTFIPKEEFSIQLYHLQCLQRVALTKEGAKVVQEYIDEINERYVNVKVLRG